MMNRKRILSGGLAAFIALTPAAYAGNGVEGGFTAVSILHLALLLCAIVGLIWAMKILSLVRGGLMSKSWQMILVGFICLCLAQAVALVSKLGFLAVPEIIVTLLYLSMAATWLAGLYQTRKVLG